MDGCVAHGQGRCGCVARAEAIDERRNALPEDDAKGRRELNREGRDNRRAYIAALEPIGIERRNLVAPHIRDWNFYEPAVDGGEPTLLPPPREHPDSLNDLSGDGSGGFVYQGYESQGNPGENFINADGTTYNFTLTFSRDLTDEEVAALWFGTHVQAGPDACTGSSKLWINASGEGNGPDGGVYAAGCGPSTGSGGGRRAPGSRRPTSPPAGRTASTRSSSSSPRARPAP